MSIKHIAVAGTLILTLGVANSAKAASLKTLYSFCSQGGTNCTDGFQPAAGLIMDEAGNLYGTTELGGVVGLQNAGTVFELTPNVTKTKWVHKTLYSFCSQDGANCTDGALPHADLIMDVSGRLYGTTAGGGANNGGTVFELTPNASKTKWTETILYSFCARGGTNCTDGRDPKAGLVMDTSGKLYSTTSSGGAHNGGTVFELTPNATKTKWTETVLYSFCARGGTNCTDGALPYAGMVMDNLGNFFGTTSSGGVSPTGIAGQQDRRGTVFELTPNPAATTWTHKLLYSFCSQGPQSGCIDGSLNTGVSNSLTIDASGNLYGMTIYGGANDGPFGFGAGTVYKLTPNSARTKWTKTILYNFCAKGGKDKCTDGGQPTAGLVMDDASGKLYGTTTYGGFYQTPGTLPLGTVFELTPAAKTSWTETVLKSFCSPSAANCTAGAFPFAGLILNATIGNLYGTTAYGGSNNGPSGLGGGTVFELKR